ncbi:DUF5681 domain-containing protein [uncultured Bradyrhizobium sp.]|jgi:hypothetical protein|uniref:DUF5681 domain-containing protein n=1 Tax=uncultured Bradyrhizobium sp. TaxID=199684 RepID=UPI002609E510|nr:DUF5681 domain-containing protein [uncultured Bradyrhizobium sp.]
MDDQAGSNKTQNAGWFPKGRSGNPKGRPRGSGKRMSSAFEVLLEKTLTVTMGNKTREVSAEEALQERTFKDALAGKRMAVKEVLKWIMAYEEWQAQNAPRPPRKSLPYLSSPDPDNADEALLLLGIADHNPERADPDVIWPRAQLLLEPWATQLALRRRREPLERRDYEEVQRCTRDPDSLIWPD